MTSTVHLEIPASGAYLAVARAAATGLAAQLQFTYEEIDDLRIAVDEACTQLLARRGSATTLNVAYRLEDAELRVDVSIEAPDCSRTSSVMADRICQAKVSRASGSPRSGASIDTSTRSSASFRW